MTTESMIGYFVLVLMCATGFVVWLFAALFGAVVLKRQWLRGVELKEKDEKVGRELHAIVNDASELYKGKGLE